MRRTRTVRTALLLLMAAPGTAVAQDVVLSGTVTDTTGHHDRYVRFRGGGALHRVCRGGRGVHRSGRGARCRQPDLYHATGGAGSRKDVSGIDKGGDQVVPGLSRRREGGVMCRDEGGAQRFDAPVAEAGSCFPGFYSHKGESLSPSGVGLGRFWVLVNLFTGLVAPTTCSLTTCLTTCMVYP